MNIIVTFLICVHILKELKTYFYYFQIFVSACRYVDMNAGTCRGQKCKTTLSASYIQMDHGENAGDLT